LNAEDIPSRINQDGKNDDLNQHFDVKGAAEVYCQAQKCVDNAFKNPRVLSIIKELLDLSIQ